ALYRSGGNFTDVYRVPLADLENEWRQFLAQQPLITRARAHASEEVPLTARERPHASEELRRPAIFKRVCARELAARMVEARGIEREDPARAVALLEAACHDHPSEASYPLARGGAHPRHPRGAELPAGAGGGAGAGGPAGARAGDAVAAGGRRRHHGA